jgi:hypothetical protein
MMGTLGSRPLVLFGKKLAALTVDTNSSPNIIAEIIISQRGDLRNQFISIFRLYIIQLGKHWGIQKDEC